MKKKLTIVIPSLAAGGSERVVSILLNTIDKNQFDVSLILIDGSAPFYTIDASEIEVYDLKIKRLRHAFLPLRRTIKAINPDIVLSTLGYLNIFLGLIRRFLPTHTRFVARESSIISINNQLYRWPALWHFLTRLAYRHIDFCICQSAYMQNDLVEKYGVTRPKTTVIFNPIDTHKAPTTVEKVQRPHPVFITVGRLNPEKGYLRLLDALEQAEKNGLTHFEYHILGEGPDRAAIEARIAANQWQDKIRLHGLVRQPLQHLAAADFYLHGSHFEGFPNAILEAGLCGLPTLAFDMPGGTNEILSQNFNGYIVNSTAAFAQQLIEMVRHDTFDRAAIQAHIKNQFEAQHIIKQYEATLLAL